MTSHIPPHITHYIIDNWGGITRRGKVNPPTNSKRTDLTTLTSPVS